MTPRNNFQSWRDFSSFDEYNLKEAESRLEKRWMEKENKKIREKYVKEERARINKLVMLANKQYVFAQRSDPRVRREEERLEQERVSVGGRRRSGRRRRGGGGRSRSRGRRS